MPEQEVWLTSFFNQHFAGFANWIISLGGLKAENPAHPWANWASMEVLVFLILVLLVALVRPRLSMNKPGRLQHLFELTYEFLCGQSADSGIEHYQPYVPLFGTIFLFILLCNLIGVVPGFEAPTQTPIVPLGCAVLAFLYYNLMGFKKNGVLKYLAHFAGPSLALAFLMIPIEVISHLARMLSLTVRLFANMFAGEKVTLAFLRLSYLILPAAFMGLHVFECFLQAYVFALLTMIYVSGAVAHEH